MTDTTPKSRFGNQPWKGGPLYAFMLNLFPEHRTLCQFLDVARLSTELKLSRQRIYQCLHTSTLTPGNAEAIRKLAASDQNAAALTALGRKIPERKDFDPFVYPA